MTDILVGAKVKAADFPVTVYASDSTLQNAISTTTYTNGSPTLAVTFIAPTSGRVLVTVGGGFNDASGVNRVHLAPLIRITNGAGAIFLAADVVGHGVGSAGASVSNSYYSRTTLVDGLTPGQTYYAHTAHKVSGGLTADIANRDIMVEPTS